MWERTRLQVSNFNLLTLLGRWFNRNEKETMETTQQASSGTQYYQRVEGDWLAEDPRSWYCGPLEVFTQSQTTFIGGSEDTLEEA